MDLEVEQKMANISLANTDTEDHELMAKERTSSQESSVTEEDSESTLREKFKQLLKASRQCAEEGDISKAISLNEEALKISYSEKLVKRIQKMKDFLRKQKEENLDDEDDLANLGQGFMLHRGLVSRLYKHQRDGVLWMWSLFLRGKGGILADDMGLGKTIQVIAFLAGMFDMDKIKSVMIVVPLSVLPNWMNEFAKWTPGITVLAFHSGSQREKERALARVRGRGGVLLTTYGLMLTQQTLFSERHGREFVWDYIFLDEGHKIKNATKTSKSVNGVPAKNRIILTGTPVQNNLKELWSLFDYVHQGSLLGTVRTFKMEFETPITRARERDATAVEKRLGQEMAETLKEIIQPYFLRRTKAAVSDMDSSRDETCLKMPTMTRKNDLVLWVHLTQTQQQIYQDFLSLDSVKELLMTKKSPLVALTVLKKICDHPRLLSTRACLQLGLDGDDFNEEDLEQPSAYESAVNQITKIDDEVLVGDAGKMGVLVDLLDNFKAEGHKVLVFSQSRKLLDIIQKVITNRGHKVARLDGTITQLSERAAIVKKFQNDMSYSVFLLTIQVGGVGLTITAADRVIIYDPSWNPAADAQAVDRVYRIGQQKNVVVYRMITCGTVEEKIYRRQVFKDSITRQTTGASKNPYRYFTKMELRELFTLDDPQTSKTQQQLMELHGNQRVTDESLDEHIAFLHSLDIFGISDHDLMFQQTAIRDDEEDNDGITAENDNNAQFIHHRVQKAQMAIAEESNIPIPYEERTRGVQRLPPSFSTGTDGMNRPGARGSIAPSGLFTQISSSPPSDSAAAVQDVNDVSVHSGDKDSMPNVIDLTIDDTAVDSHKSFTADRVEIVASPSPKPYPERRVLQPLTPSKIRERSPQVSVKGQKGPIVSEELLISPDCQRPVIGLTQKTKEMESSPLKSVLDSPSRQWGKMSPSKLSFSPKRLMSPGKLLSSSPARSESSPNKALGSPLQARLSSPADSPKQKLSNQLRRSLFSSMPLAQQVKGEEILAADSPDEKEKASASPLNSSNFSAMEDKTLDISDACRKLLFSVPDSRDTSLNVGPTPGSSPLPKKQRPSLIDEESNSSISQKAYQSVGAPGFKVQDETTLKNLLSESYSMKRLNSSILSDGGDSRQMKSSTRKRRSVCVSKAPQLQDSSASDEEGEANDENVSSHFKEDENNENDDFATEEDSDEDDKENDPGVMRLPGGRNLMVSDSDSESGSCFEVEEEEEEAGTTEIGEEETAAAAAAAPMSADVVESDPTGEEEAYVDEEMERQFHDHVSVARKCYKEKNYRDSLLFVEEALKIIPEPGLMEMAEKIRQKIEGMLQEV